MYFKTVWNKVLINFPTRITSNTATATDNVLTNLNQSQIQVQSINTLLSEQNTQLINIINKVPEKQPSRYLLKNSRVFS